MAVTMMEAALALDAAMRVRRFIASFDEGPWCECWDLPLSDPCTLCVEQGRFRNARYGVRPPRETGVMLGIDVPDYQGEVCTCPFLDLDRVCPACAARGFTENDDAPAARDGTLPYVLKVTRGID
jgi:hypothetical protein